MTDTTARMVEAEQAAQAVTHYLSPAIAVCRAEYLQRVLDITRQPDTEANLAGARKLSVAMKVLDELEAQLVGIIMDGKVAKHDAERASRMANLTTEQRRWYQFAGGK